MDKKFIRPNWKALRKLESNLREAFFYCWDKADNIGVYEYDPDYMFIDLGFRVPFNDLLQLPGAVKISPDKFLFEDFIIVNYVQLKPNYNPHKPAFRDLAKNLLTLNSSLNQACLKLVDEGEDKEEDVDEEFGKSENLLNGDAIVPEMCQQFRTENPGYAFDQKTDFPVVREIGGKILAWLKLPGEPQDIQNSELINRRWGELVLFIRDHPHFRGYSLSQINKHFQSIAQSFTSGQSGKKDGKWKRATQSATGSGNYSGL